MTTSLKSIQHIGVIMDGNGRWANRKGLPRIEGHRQGAEKVRNILECCLKAGVNYLTLYSFSTENWCRPKDEIEALLKLIKSFLPKQANELKKHGVKLETIGNLAKFPKDVVKVIEDAKELTKDGTKLTLILALNYGGRDEILRAALKLKDLKIDITEENFSKLLDTKDIPDPEIIIRTAGEQRMSNFMTWQSIYSELFFLNKTWPEFSEEDFNQIIESYSTRKRKFGGVT